MEYPKRSQNKYAKPSYRIRNWPEYKAGLRRRGDRTVWLCRAAWLQTGSRYSSPHIIPTPPILPLCSRNHGWWTPITRERPLEKGPRAFARSPLFFHW
jgi:hypothetical protein